MFSFTKICIDNRILLSFMCSITTKSGNGEQDRSFTIKEKEFSAIGEAVHINEKLNLIERDIYITFLIV